MDGVNGTTISLSQLTQRMKTQMARTQQVNQRIHKAVKKQSDLRDWCDKNLSEVEEMVARARGQHDSSDEETTETSSRA